MDESGASLVELAARYRRWPAGGAPDGSLSDANPLATGAIAAMAGGAFTPPLVVWSGWMGDEPASLTGQIEPDFRNWNGLGRRRLDEVVAAWRGSDQDAARWIRPHSRHVLSDGPSCAAFARTHADAIASGRLALLLDLDLLIAPEMAPRREDHARRLIESAWAMGRAVAGLAMPRADWEGVPGREAEVLGAAVCRLEAVGL